MSDDANQLRLIAASVVNKLWAMREVSQLEILKWQVDASLEDAKGAAADEHANT